jgi:steroid delta-isomerase-like uncharacterized protein
MSIEGNKEVVRRYQAAYNRGDLEALDAMVDARLVTHSQAPGLPPGLEGGKQAHRMTVAAFPDLHYETDELVAEGDTVVQRFTITGTHGGEFMGLPASGRPIRFSGVSFFRLKDGKIVEHWGLQDGLTLMFQVGIFPPPGGEPS